MSMAMKKCIVLDLDNTLWGGIAGEDGINGVELSMDERGSGFIAFQQALLDMYHRGVILAINSHNNPEDALAVIRNHPNMILKEPHFAAMRMNWNDKHENIKSLAEELNIGLDSMVFFDDNPLHREMVRSFLPEVDVPELPTDPVLYTKILHALPYFPSHATTNEDTMRGNLYVTERLRREAEKRFTSKEDFLTSLGLEAYIEVNDTNSVARIAQLTEKTNQFNTKKNPLSTDEVISLMQGDTHEILSMRVIDRFGDYGVIGVAIVEKKTDVWHVEQLLMSCRILGRGAEEALLFAIAERARLHGADHLSFAYAPTEKNAPAKTFLDTTIKNLSRFDITTNALTPPPWLKVTIHTT